MLSLNSITSYSTSGVTSMGKVIGKSKLWGKNYTTVPVLVRRLLDLKEGNEIEWILDEDNEIIIRKRD